MSSSTSPSETPSSGPHQTLDRSQSAPATMEQASVSGQCQDQPGLQELVRPSSLAETSASSTDQVQPQPLPVHNNSEVPPIPSSSTDILPTHTPTADMLTLSQCPEGEVLCAAKEGDAESFEAVNSSTPSHPGELSPVQPMEQEMTESDTADTGEACTRVTSQLNSVEMESPTTSHGMVTSERDQPEGEHCSSSDSIPSLAAALMELHELLVSNNRAHSQNHSTSCSPSHPLREDTDESAPKPRTPTPEDSQPAPCTAITADEELSDAKANHAVAVSDEGSSKCLVPDHDEHHARDTAETMGEQGPPQHPDGSRERAADGCGLDEASNVSISQPKPEVPPDSAGNLEFREPPEGQQGRGVADGQASGTNSPDSLGLQTEQTFLSPLSMAAGSPEEVCSTSSISAPSLVQAPQPTSAPPLLPSPHPFIEQFPAEHIQRIQAAGFSAREAAEALEQAHGVVELALLALLSRSITVPT
uniref:UBA domain-containing protein n=2 Tax=Echeneis naucrates TaxID=173247 RepID=A0A665T8G1_ECHNA